MNPLMAAREGRVSRGPRVWTNTGEARGDRVTAVATTRGRQQRPAGCATRTEGGGGGAGGITGAMGSI